MASASDDQDSTPTPSVETTTGADSTSHDEVATSIEEQVKTTAAVFPHVDGESNSANGNESVAESRQRTVPQPMKRRPDKDLNHDNWDEEDEPEEKGEFIKASEEKLKDRKILTAKRKQNSASSTGNPFGGLNFASGSGFGGFGGGSNLATGFNFSTAQSQLTPAFNFSTTQPQLTSAFNFSSTQSQASMTVPKFDFSSISSNPTKPDKDASNAGQAKKVKTSEVVVAPQVGIETNNDEWKETVSQPPALEEAKRQRTVPQPMKRRPDKDLNHDNWDQEDEPEEKGEFVKASEDNLKNRKILTAKRKNQNSNPSENPFGAINFGTGFGSNGGGLGTFSTPAFNFSTAQPLATATPKFDFSNLWKDKDENKADKNVNGKDQTTETEVKTTVVEVEKHESSRDSAEDGSSATATTV